MQARWISRIQKGFLILGIGGALTACKGDDPWEPDAEWIAMAGGDADSELAKRLNVELRLILPREPKKNWVFDGYTNSRTGEVAWSRSWTSKIDFTGVSWDKSKNLTMITIDYDSYYSRILRLPDNRTIYEGPGIEYCFMLARLLGTKDAKKV